MELNTSYFNKCLIFQAVKVYFKAEARASTKETELMVSYFKHCTSLENLVLLKAVMPVLNCKVTYNLF